MPKAALNASCSPIKLGRMVSTDDLGTALHEAAVHGDKKKLKRLLKTGINVDYPNSAGQTALFCSCFEGHEGIVEILLLANANPNERCNEGSTAVHAAGYSCVPKILCKLIEAGGDLRLHDTKGRTVKDWVLCQGDPKKRRKMLEYLEKTRHVAMTNSGRDLLLEKQSCTYHGSLRNEGTLSNLLKLKHSKSQTLSPSVHSHGFGKIYLGEGEHVGTMATIPLVPENSLRHDEYGFTFNNGPFMVMESMLWQKVQVTVKRLHRDPPEGGQVDLLITENEFMARLRHPHILLLMGVCQTNNLEGLVLLYERVGCGSLFSYLYQKAETMNTLTVCTVMKQISEALLYLHQQNLLHCSISSHAVQLVLPNLAKLCNFDSMVENVNVDGVGPKTIAVENKYQNAVYNWAAPELLAGKSPTEKSDLYSLCAVLWEVLHGMPPWSGQQAQEIVREVVENQTMLEIKDTVKNPFSALLQYGLCIEPKSRQLTVEQFRDILAQVLVDHDTMGIKGDTPQPQRLRAKFITKQAQFSNEDISSGEEETMDVKNRSKRLYKAEKTTQQQQQQQQHVAGSSYSASPDRGGLDDKLQTERKRKMSNESSTVKSSGVDLTDSSRPGEQSVKTCNDTNVKQNAVLEKASKNETNTIKASKDSPSEIAAIMDLMDAADRDCEKEMPEWSEVVKKSVPETQAQAAVTSASAEGLTKPPEFRFIQNPAKRAFFHSWSKEQLDTLETAVKNGSKELEKRNAVAATQSSTGPSQEPSKPTDLTKDNQNNNQNEAKNSCPDNPFKEQYEMTKRDSKLICDEVKERLRKYQLPPKYNSTTALSLQALFPSRTRIPSKDFQARATVYGTLSRQFSGVSGTAPRCNTYAAIAKSIDPHVVHSTVVPGTQLNATDSTDGHCSVQESTIVPVTVSRDNTARQLAFSNFEAKLKPGSRYSYAEDTLTSPTRSYVTSAMALDNVGSRHSWAVHQPPPPLPEPQGIFKPASHRAAGGHVSPFKEPPQQPHNFALPEQHRVENAACFSVPTLDVKRSSPVTARNRRVKHVRDELDAGGVHRFKSDSQLVSSTPKSVDQGQYVEPNPERLSPREQKKNWYGQGGSIDNLISSFDGIAQEHVKKQTVLVMKSKAQLNQLQQEPSVATVMHATYATSKPQHHKNTLSSLEGPKPCGLSAKLSKASVQFNKTVDLAPPGHVSNCYMYVHNQQNVREKKATAVSEPSEAGTEPEVYDIVDNALRTAHSEVLEEFTHPSCTHRAQSRELIQGMSLRHPSNRYPPGKPVGGCSTKWCKSQPQTQRQVCQASQTWGQTRPGHNAATQALSSYSHDKLDKSAQTDSFNSTRPDDESDTGSVSVASKELEEFYFDDELHPGLMHENHLRLQSSLAVENNNNNATFDDIRFELSPADRSHQADEVAAGEVVGQSCAERLTDLTIERREDGAVQVKQKLSLESDDGYTTTVTISSRLDGKHTITQRTKNISTGATSDDFTQTVSANKLVSSVVLQTSESESDSESGSDTSDTGVQEGDQDSADEILI